MRMRPSKFESSKNRWNVIFRTENRSSLKNRWKRKKWRHRQFSRQTGGIVKKYDTWWPLQNFRHISRHHRFSSDVRFPVQKIRSTDSWNFRILMVDFFMCSDVFLLCHSSHGNHCLSAVQNCPPKFRWHQFLQVSTIFCNFSFSEKSVLRHILHTFISRIQQIFPMWRIMFFSFLGVTFDWLLVDFWMTLKCILGDFLMTFGWVLNDFWTAVGWLFDDLWATFRPLPGPISGEEVRWFGFGKLARNKLSKSCPKVIQTSSKSCPKVSQS